MSTTSNPDSGVAAAFDARRPEHWIAFGFGAGLAPMAPGTMGTLVAVPIYLLLVWILPTTLYVIAVAALIALGAWACERVLRETGAADPPAIVWDEVVGFLVAMTAVPLGLPWVIAGFLLFRLFDVYKPWPVSWAQNRFRGGLGIIADDLVAGALTWVILHGMHRIVIASLGHGAAH